MRFIISKRNLYFIFVYLLLIIFSIIGVDTAGDTFSFLVWIDFAALVVFLIQRRHSIVSVITFTILFLYIYNCGQVWLYYLGYSFSYSSFLITQFSIDEINISLHFFNIIILVMQMSLSYFDNAPMSECITDDNRSSELNFDSTLNLITSISYAFCLVVLLYNDLIQMISARVVGYSSSFLLGRDNHLVYMMINLYPFLMALMILQNSNWKRKFAIIHAIARALLMMLIVGNRGQYIAILCTLYIIILFTSKKQHNNSLIWTIVFGFILMVLASYIANIRNITEGKSSFIQFLIQYNVVGSILQELGGTAVDLILVVKNCPQTIAWGYGVSYIGGVIQFIPFFPRLFPDLCKYNNIVTILNSVFAKGSGLGGSFIAELYLNFSWFSVLVVPFFAWGLSKLDILTKNNSLSNLKRAICFYFTYAVFMYTRYNFSDFAVYARYLCYFLLIYIVMKSISARRT